MTPRTEASPRHRPPGLPHRRLGYRLASLAFGSPLYGLTLPARATGTVGPTGGDSWPGNAVQGSAIAQGMFAFAGQAIYNPAPFWAPVGAAHAWLAELHGFAWLRDLKAMEDETGRGAARALIRRWIDDNGAWHPLAWRPDVLGARLANWLALHDFYGANADAELRPRLMASARRQAQHLARVLPGPLAGSALLAALKGLVYAGLALPKGEAWLRRGSELLQVELQRQLLADGGHIERSPSVHGAVLRHLVDVRTALEAAGRPATRELYQAIENLAPVLRMLRHGDGGFALFNDSDEEEAWRIDAVLARAGAGIETASEARATGFQRLAAGRTVVVVDSGAPPPAGYDSHAHAGTLSLEMSVGRERLIVNCGAHPSDPNWRLAQRNTAAHSTLIVDDTNSAVLLPEGGIGRGPRRVQCKRQESEGSVWLDLSHDGYRHALGLEHRRRLYLSPYGDELRGEDRVTGKRLRPYAIRFHLHPDVQVSLTRNRQGGILRLHSGAGWRMRALGGEVAIDDSVYLGRGGQLRKTQQIVVSVQHPTPEDAVKWVFARETRR